jgi:hypothetical protein
MIDHDKIIGSLEDLINPSVVLRLIEHPIEHIALV